MCLQKWEVQQKWVYGTQISLLGRFVAAQDRFAWLIELHDELIVDYASILAEPNPNHFLNLNLNLLMLMLIFLTCHVNYPKLICILAKPNPNLFANLGLILCQFP